MLNIPNLKTFNVPMNEIQHFCRQNHILKLMLFGSILRKDFNEKSDIDILVKFDPDHIPGLFQIVRIEKELGKFFNNRKVDLRTIDDLSRYFRDDVVSKGCVIYDG